MKSVCVGRGTTWQPCYIVARDDRGLAGALPLFIKYDSHGEFVFDWSWADAYERAGRSYYPKLVSAVPFTPATGRRLLLRDAGPSDVAVRLVEAARATAEELGASSLHVLFPTEPERELLAGRGFLTRKGCQFHWVNDGYGSFDEFLGRFSADKRKTYCLYEAPSEEAIREAARRNGIPADAIVAVDELRPEVIAAGGA